MIATTDAYKTVGCVGQNCINASFMSLSDTIDGWQNIKNEQDYKTLDYKGSIDMSTTLCCCPPSSAMNVYGSPGDGKLYCIGHMDTNGVVTFDDLSQIKTTCDNVYSWSTSTKSSYYPYSYGIKSYSTFTAWNDMTPVACACYISMCDDCIERCYCDGTIQYKDGCVEHCALYAGSFQCDKDLNVCRSIKCYDVVEQWLENPGCLAAGIGIVCRGSAPFGHVIDTICWCCTCTFTDYDGNTVTAPWTEDPADQVIAYFRYDVNPDDSINMFYSPNPSDTRCLFMCTYLNIFPWNYKCLHMDAGKLMHLCWTNDCCHPTLINAGGDTETAPLSPRLCKYESCCALQEIPGFNCLFSPTYGPQCYPYNETEEEEVTCCDEDGCEYTATVTTYDNTCCCLDTECCTDMTFEMAENDPADAWIWTYCRHMSSRSTVTPVVYSETSGCVYCTTCKEWQWTLCDGCWTYSQVDAPQCCYFPHYIASNPNGLHVSSDQTTICPEADICWDTDNGAVTYICCLQEEADNGYYTPVMRDMSICMNDCTVTCCSGDDCTTYQCGWFANGCCYALWAAMTLDTGGSYGVTQGGGDDSSMSWSGDCRSINFLSSLTVVRRKTTVYYVNETITRCRDLSGCTWCIYMEYI